MSEIEVLRGRVAALEWRLDVAIVVGFVVLGGLIVWMTMRGRRIARLEQWRDAREGKGVAGEILRVLRRVPKRR